MKPFSLLIGLFFAICAGAATIWIGGPAPEEDERAKEIVVEDDIPVPSKDGPHPQAIFDETSYNFGVMEHMQEGTHTFRVTNEGEAPLELVARKEDATCQCTVGEVGKDGLAPGESTEIELKWKIKSPLPHFAHSAVIRTNDPERVSIRLQISGRVGRPLVVLPSNMWAIGLIDDALNHERTVSGTIHTETEDEFEIHEIIPSTPGMFEVEYERITDEIRLGEIRAKVGYDVRAKLIGPVPVGTMREFLTVKSSIKTDAPTKIQINGTRPGPFRIQGGGSQWIPDQMRLMLGKISSEKGEKVRLSMYVTVPEGLEFEFGETDRDPEYLQVTISEGSKLSETKWLFHLEFEVPPGSPKETYHRGDPAIVTLNSNHPEMKQVKFQVQFVCF